MCQEKYIITLVLYIDFFFPNQLLYRKRKTSLSAKVKGKAPWVQLRHFSKIPFGIQLNDSIIIYHVITIIINVIAVIHTCRIVIPAHYNNFFLLDFDIQLRLKVIPNVSNISFPTHALYQRYIFSFAVFV